MKKLLALGGMAALLLTGCARDDYRGGTWDTMDTSGSGRAGSWGGGVDNHTGVISSPSSLGGRTHDPFRGAINGIGQGPDTTDRGAANAGDGRLFDTRPVTIPVPTPEPIPEPIPEETPR